MDQEREAALNILIARLVDGIRQFAEEVWHANPDEDEVVIFAVASQVDKNGSVVRQTRFTDMSIFPLLTMMLDAAQGVVQDTAYAERTGGVLQSLVDLGAITDEGDGVYRVTGGGLPR